MRFGRNWHKVPEARYEVHVKPSEEIYDFKQAKVIRRAEVDTSKTLMREWRNW